MRESGDHNMGPYGSFFLNSSFRSPPEGRIVSYASSPGQAIHSPSGDHVALVPCVSFPELLYAGIINVDAPTKKIHDSAAVRRPALRRDFTLGINLSSSS